MSQTQIVHRYAQALFDLASQDDSFHAVHVSLQEIAKLFNRGDEFKIFIHNPLLSLEERKCIIQRLFENKIPALLYKFLLFLNAKNRFNILGEICKNFDELYVEKNHQMRASLETVFTLEEGQKQNIRQKLSQKYNKKVSLDCQIKKDLLGGFRLLAAGMLFDSSVKSQLEQFRQKVLA
ncbi:MAG: ATP synthase F1 subunit delta [Candidatus Omnitrophica bacterium]|nr:ATP synthase F1 subunit delta [Candidatus Omnitrophota bacterium]